MVVVKLRCSDPATSSRCQDEGECGDIHDRVVGADRRRQAVGGLAHEVQRPCGAAGAPGARWGLARSPRDAARWRAAPLLAWCTSRGVQACWRVCLNMM
jgi:hypothetical protein